MDAGLRRVVYGVGMVALSRDADGRVTYANDQVCRMTGWAREELCGGDWFATVGTDSARAAYAAVLAGEAGARPSEETVTTRAGEARIVRLTHAIDRDAAGQVAGVTSIGVDVTAERAAEEVKAAILDAALDAIVGTG